MLDKHALAARILKEAEDKGITLVTAKPVDRTEYSYGATVGQECYPDVKLLPEPHEDIPIVSPAMVPKLTGMPAEEYLNRREQLKKAAEKMARNAKMIERANAHLRKFDLTEEAVKLALKYISSMMPKRYQLSTDGKVSELDYLSRYGIAKRMEYVIEDRVSGFSTTRPLNVIDGMICIRSDYPRWTKRAFEFQLRQHLDYELRFKKRDQDRHNTIFC